MKENSKALDRIVTVIGIVLCVVFGTLLALNLTIIVKGLINPDRPPSVFGRTPMVVKSGSMSSDVLHLVQSDDIIGLTEEQKAALKPGDTFETKSGSYTELNKVETASVGESGKVTVTSTRPAEDHIEVDDLIFAKNADFGALEVGQIVTFMERDLKGQLTGAVVTHRIIDIETKDGKKVYRTKGDANNTIDTVPVAPEDIVGVYSLRIAKLGAFIFFLQKPWGMVIFIGVPVLAFIIYDIIRRQRYAKKDDTRVEELEEELRRLREQAAKKEGSPDDGDKKE